MKLTIEKFQRLHSLAKLEEGEIDKTKRIIQILLGKSIEEIEKMPLKKFKKVCDDLKIIFDQNIDKAIATNPERLIKANGNWYRLNFEIKRPFNTGRYIEVVTFSKDDPVMDMHNILASICTPTKWDWKKLKLIDQPYDALDHEKYADDFKKADFKHGYHAMVFFCTFLASLMSNTKDYSEKQILNLVMNKKKINQLKINFKKTLAGSIMQDK